MPSTRSKSSKKQTRLAFTPVPSSSPQASKLPSSLQSRAAAVRFDTAGSPSQRRRTARTLHQDDGEAIALATSLSAPTSSSSPFKRRFSSVRRPDHLLPTPEASSQFRAGEAATEWNLHSSSSESSLPSLENLNASAKKPRTTSSKPPNAETTSGERQDTSGEDPSPVLPRRSRHEVPSHTAISSGGGESEDDDISPSSPLRGSAPNHTSPSPFRKTIDTTPSKDSRSNSSPRWTRSSVNTQLATDRSKRRSTRLRNQAPVHEPDSDSSITAISTAVEDTSRQGVVLGSESDSDVPITPARSGRKRLSFALGESEDSDDMIQSPSKRKRLVPSNRHTPSRRGFCRQDEEDIEEDLEVLQDTEVRDERTRGRTVPSKREAKQRQLEILKARRAGRMLNGPSPDSEVGPKSPQVIYDSESEDEVRSAGEESDRGAEAIRQSLLNDNDSYEEDFVDDDDADTLGAPLGLEDIPLEFTRHAHKKAKEHFKDAVEWMVHKKLNPAFARDDPVYRVAFHKLEDEVKGYAGSKFLSAAWTGDFARALKARPEFFELAIPFSPHDYHHCDACNRTNHPAKFMITFGGKAYHPESLEIMADDSDDDAERSDDDVRSRDAVGNPIPPLDKEYFVGRFCKANASIAHSLLHWRYHLNEWVLDFLTASHYLTPQKILERDSWSIKKRGDYANGVVDEMEAQGEVRALWRDFKINLDQARNYKPEAWRR